LAAVFLLASQALAADLDWDEGMYVTAGALSRERALYRDFAFLQGPYLPLLYGQVFRLYGGTQLLLAARLVNVVFAAAAMVAVVAMVRRVSGRALGAAAGVLFLCNDLLQLRLSTSCNDALAMSASALACWLLVGVVEGAAASRAPWRSAAVGLLLGVATGTKLYYAPLLAVAALALVGAPSDPSLARRARRCLLPMIVGAGLALLPIALLWARSPAAVFFDLYGYHAVNARWRAMTSDGGSPGKLLVAWKALATPGAVVAVLLLGLLGVGRREVARLPSLSAVWGVWQRLLRVDAPWVAGAFALVCLAVSFAPTPPWPHYFALPIPFAIVLAGMMCGRVPLEERAAARRAFAVATVLVSCLGGARLLKGATEWAHPGRTTVLALHAEARRLHSLAGGGRMATLFPLYAVEGGFEVYPELATAAFAYRVADLVSPETRAAAHLTSPKTIAETLDARPPSALLVGFETDLDLEEPLESWAVSHGYARRDVRVPGRTARLYLRPGDNVSTR
jgi:hypothetical protein